MTKQEFETRIGQQVSTEDYKKIEQVYTFHPSIDNVNGKDQIAMLYSTFGMRIIADMLPAAMLADELEREIAAAEAQLKTVQERYENFKKGLF